MTSSEDSARGGPPAGTEPPSANASRRWSGRLAAWAVPRDILAAAPRPPWYLPPDLLQAHPAAQPDTPSTGLARAALPGCGGSVLDVGCGAGRAALALVPPAARLIGVDRSAAHLDAFRSAAGERGVPHVAVQGEWPGVAGDVPEADVVVCHHVVYHVHDLAAFGRALHDHARRRVVLELLREHPMAPTAALWRQFWGLERPAGPTAIDAVAVFREAGLPARQVTWRESRGMSRLAGLPFDRQVEITRIRLCLPTERDAEVAAALRAAGPQAPREVVTVWWDRAAASE